MRPPISSPIIGSAHSPTTARMLKGSQSSLSAVSIQRLTARTPSKRIEMLDNEAGPGDEVSRDFAILLYSTLNGISKFSGAETPREIIHLLESLRNVSVRLVGLAHSLDIRLAYTLNYYVEKQFDGIVRQRNDLAVNRSRCKYSAMQPIEMTA